jgi:hypothetical protein
LFDVAGRPSSKPVRASRAEPVQTVVVMRARWLAAARRSRKGWSATALREPNPPGISRMS